MAFVLAVLSLVVGMALPFLSSVAYVLYVSIALAVGCVVFGLIFHADVLMLLLAWIASIVALQAGFALSLAGLAFRRRSKDARQRSAMSASGQALDAAASDLDRKHLSSN